MHCSSTVVYGEMQSNMIIVMPSHSSMRLMQDCNGLLRQSRSTISSMSRARHSRDGFNPFLFSRECVAVDASDEVLLPNRHPAFSAMA
jgi:hypothetical protein